jgi:hypothetical protein
MNDDAEALYRALHELAYLVDENVPVAQQSRELNNALAYAFELMEAFNFPGIPKSRLIKSLTRNNPDVYDVPLIAVSMDDMRGTPTLNQ